MFINSEEELGDEVEDGKEKDKQGKAGEESGGVSVGGVTKEFDDEIRISLVKSDT